MTDDQRTWRCPDCCGVGGCQTCSGTGELPSPVFGCATCGNKVGAKHENACAKRGHIVASADCFVHENFDRDTDGELLIDWSPSKGRMVTLSLRDDGRLSYAVLWDEEHFHGHAQMPSPLPVVGPSTKSDPK